MTADNRFREHSTQRTATFVDTSPTAPPDLLENLLENPFVGVVVLNASGRVARVNRSFTRITGYSAADMPALRGWLSPVSPDPSSGYHEPNGRDGPSSKTAAPELEISCKTGETKWVRCHEKPLADGGSLIFLMESPSRTDDALSYFKTAVDHASDAIGMSTPDGRHWYQNDAFDKLFGEIGEDPPVTLYADESLGRTVFKTLMSGGQWSGELEMYDRNGRIMDIMLRAYSIKDERGEVAGLVGTHTNITARKHREKELQRTKALLEAAINQSPSGILIADAPDVRIRIANPAAFGIRGGNPRYLTDIDVTEHSAKWQTFHLDGTPYAPRDLPLSRAVLKGEISTDVEVIIRDQDGEERRVLASAAPIRDDNGVVQAGIVIFHDITEKMKMERQLQQAQKFEAIGTLAGGIAHDFNNLLMGIQGRASLMMLDTPPSHSHLEHIKAIDAYVRSATTLTRQLLGFARGGRYEVQPLDLNELLTLSARMFGRTKKEIRIHIAPHDTPVVVDADKGQLEQVLLNMYVNAWQAMPEGGNLFLGTTIVELGEARCAPHQLRPGLFAKVSVADSGIGMDDTTRQLIFDPFFTTKPKGRGTGLGLASAWGIIKNHGGMITVASEIGHGSTFDIYLPISKQAASQRIHTEEVTLRGTETILLIDDEEMIIEVTRSLLKGLGYGVEVAKTGREAIETIRRSKDEIDLIILDMIMPGMDGGGTFDRIRALRPDLPVLLSSGYAMSDQADGIMKRGCDGFIQKPYSIAELSRKIRNILDKRECRTAGG